MPRKVKTTYQKAGSTPSARQGAAQSLADPFTSRLSPLARYIAENESSGISTVELTEQFREFDCEHTRKVVIAETSEKKVYGCEDCGQLETVLKPGAK